VAAVDLALADPVGVDLAAAEVEAEAVLVADGGQVGVAARVAAAGQGQEAEAPGDPADAR
jgi:hypothetical protein